MANSNFVVATPHRYNDAGFNKNSYCAYHDWTNGTNYAGVTAGMSWTNLPYISNAGAGCGGDSINAAPAGDLDGFTIALGHEIEETITDPGAGEKDAAGHDMSGWYDLTGYENGDKCAYVGDFGVGAPSQVPGGMNNVTLSDGQPYPVQALWSNDAAGGAGYCAGAGDDLPF